MSQDDPQSLPPPSDQDEDSFFANEAKAEEDDERPAQEPDDFKQKASKPKKKHIKKKDKSSKPAKKQHTSKEKQKEHRLYLMADRKAEEIIQKMKSCHEKDLQLYERKKLACQKLNYLDTLSQQLKHLYIAQKFLEKDGLGLFERWLDKITINQETYQPSVSLRKGVLQILYSLTISPENIGRTNEIQRLVARQKRSQVRELRDLSQRIILKWNKIAYEAE